MSLPLVILAVLSIVAGYGTESYFEHAFQGLAEHAHSGFVPLLAIGAFAIGLILSFMIYQGRAKDPIVIRLFKNKFYFDELYAALIAGTHDLLAQLSAWVDKWILDGMIVRGLSGSTWGAGFMLRFLQVGNLQAYSFFFGIGAVALIYFFVFVK